MKIQLSEHFTYNKLIRFSVPSIMMMIFTSLYVLVDGLFVSNCVGDTEFAALNLIFPFLMIAGALGFMLGTGGTALVAKTLGEGDSIKANKIFSMLVWCTIIIATAIGTVCFIFIRPIAILLGAESDMVGHCVVYGRLILTALPFFMLQNLFQSFLITAERPKMGLYVTIAAGATNMVFDALFVWLFRWGLAGAAIATGISQFVGAIIPLVYFISKNKSCLRLGRFYFNFGEFMKCCTNGSSEFVSNISASVVNMIYNLQLMNLAGQDGVSAFGVIMYVQFIFVGVYCGYALSVAPVIGFHYGAGNKDELKNLLKKSTVLIGIASLALTVTAELTAPYLTHIFVGYKPSLYELSLKAYYLYSVSYLLAGFNIFASSFFTALNDGVTSAAISFLRMFVFQIISLVGLPLLLPNALKLDGIWLAIVAAEGMSLLVNVIIVIAKRKKYGYM